ncbi:MAG TPA: hypothetical protein VNT81_07035 [Vicinamibacterales bacterium]|nr:hypothetical protein [Vicinamibacterales bacterium]
MPTVFLLSPAYCGGRRAGILLNTHSEAASAREFRAGRMSLGPAFAFMSGLYFRGKLAYAERFGEPLVITPTRGLQPPSLPFTLTLLREFAVGDVSLDNPDYRVALEKDAKALARRMNKEHGKGGQVVLLGSVASGKYVDVLLPILGDRLRYPVSFIGRGDMSRGGLLLRSAASGEELEYQALTAGVRPRGPRPPKLDPATRVAVSLGHESHGDRTRVDRAVVEPALRAGTTGAKGLGAVVDIRLRPRARVHRRPRSDA